MSADGPLVVFGPTGFTGGLVLAEARSAGLPVRLVGRRREALDSVAAPGEEIRVAAADDEAALIAAFDEAFAVVSCAGPFLANGPKPVAAAIAVGAHYLDTSGEQEFARRVYEGFGDSAATRGVILLTSFGFDYVPGDFAARLAAEGLDEPLDEVIVAYSAKRLATSSGTRRTVGHVMGQSQVAWEGELVRSRFGATTRRVRFPFGEASVVEWGGTEPLTVPRHTRVRSVRSYLRAPRAAALGGRVSGAFAPLIRAAASLGGNPSESKRSRTEFTVVAEAQGPAGGCRAVVSGSDVYGLTARLVVSGVAAIRAGEAQGAGALAPAEAFDVHAFAERLAPYFRIDSVEPL